MKQMTEAKLKELLEAAYHRGFDDSERGLCDDDAEFKQRKALVAAQLASEV